MLSFFFFNDTATTEIYTLSLHDALPISPVDLDGPLGHEREHRVGAAEGDKRGAREEQPLLGEHVVATEQQADGDERDRPRHQDRKSTRLNSSHANISYAVFCLKKKNNI